MDASEFQGCCHSHIQNVEDKLNEELMENTKTFICQDLQVESKNPVSTENLNSGCHGDCCVQTASFSDNNLTRVSDVTACSCDIRTPGTGCHGDCCAPTASVPDNTLTSLSDVGACSGDVGTHNTKLTSESVQNYPWSLATLPPELLLVIFSYLDARFTLRVLTCVCRLFHNLLSPESSWKTRFGKRWPKRDKREDYDYVSRFVFLMLHFFK